MYVQVVVVRVVVWCSDLNCGCVFLCNPQITGNLTITLNGKVTYLRFPSLQNVGTVTITSTGYSVGEVSFSSAGVFGLGSPLSTGAISISTVCLEGEGECGCECGSECGGECGGECECGCGRECGRDPQVGVLKSSLWFASSGELQLWRTVAGAIHQFEERHVCCGDCRGGADWDC